MEVANPIYDVVFKYMMEDLRVAKIFLSALTSLKIQSLEILPQELSVELDNEESHGKVPKISLSIYRLDFSAIIIEENGNEKVIIIEIQKSKFVKENMRFRKYLGKQYMNSKLFQWVDRPRGSRYKAGLPILSIYLLGDTLEGFDGIPVVKVSRKVIDRHTNSNLEKSHQFIKSLFHEGIIVNIPALKEKRRDEIEKLLSIFDQNNIQENHHIMNVSELDFPKKFQPIIRRLQAAVQEKDVRDVMFVEDDFLEELRDYEFQINESKKLREEERRQKEEERRLKEEERNYKEAAVKYLYELGTPMKNIAEKLNMPLEEVQRIVS